ncbi:MAG: putative 2-dehydropantoate 2-reductase [Acidimicrobiales bacterium]
MSGAPRRYALIGAGAVGGLYGGRLAAAGHELHVLARSDAEHLRRHGLRIESPGADDFIVHPVVHTDPATIPDVDVVLIGLKTTANGDLPALLGPVARPGVTVVVLQNGLGVEEVAAAAAPGATVLGAMCFVCASRPGPGHVRLLDYGTITLAEHTPGGEPAGVTDAMSAVAGDLERSGTDVMRMPDLVGARWRKLVWNIPFNGLTVVLDAGTDELMADPDARALVVTLMAEVEAAAEATGHALPDGFVDEMLAYTEAMVAYSPSMKSDYDAGRPLELEAIYANPIRAACAAGCDVPRIEALHRQLAFLDRRPRRPPP